MNFHKNPLNKMILNLFSAKKAIQGLFLMAFLCVLSSCNINGGSSSAGEGLWEFEIDFGEEQLVGKMSVERRKVQLSSFEFEKNCSRKCQING